MSSTTTTLTPSLYRRLIVGFHTGAGNDGGGECVLFSFERRTKCAALERQHACAAFGMPYAHFVIKPGYIIQVYVNCPTGVTVSQAKRRALNKHRTQNNRCDLTQYMVYTCMRGGHTEMHSPEHICHPPIPRNTLLSPYSNITLFAQAFYGRNHLTHQFLKDGYQYFEKFHYSKSARSEKVFYYTPPRRQLIALQLRPPSRCS